MTQEATYGGRGRNGGERAAAAPRKRGVPNDEGSPENCDRAARLEEQARIADRGLDGWREAGMALGEIRDENLYKETHSTFEGYVKERHKPWEGFLGRTTGRKRARREVVRPLQTRRGDG